MPRPSSLKKPGSDRWSCVGRGLLGVSLVVGLGGCFWFDEQAQTRIVGQYYTETTADTRTRLYFDDPQEDVSEALLGNVGALGVVGSYLAVREEEKYFLFVTNAASLETARKTAVGPLALHAFRRKLQQLTGDSALQLSSKF